MSLMPAFVFVLLAFVSLTTSLQMPLQVSSGDDELLAYQRVNVTLGVMAKCPDALACESVFDKVLDRVNSKTRLTISYIGTPDKHQKFGVDCKHGDQECAANIQQLCVQDALNPQRAGDEYDLSPSAAQKIWWNFIQCQNYAGVSKIGDENLARKCLNLVGGPQWEQDGIHSCIHGSKGRKLLRRSIASSQRNNIARSCTIQIEGKTVCIRDDGAWKQCDSGHQIGDFVSQIEEAWNRLNQAKLPSLSPAATPSSTTQAAARLHKRQTSPSASPTYNNNPLGGSGTPPSVFTLVIAIALFVVVVCFVLLRIIMRNRRLRRLGLLPDGGPFDRLLGPPREVEDTLIPPKLLEARITHDYRPALYQADVKRHGWDAVMPISAALPPNLYVDLFASELKAKEAGQSNDADFSYPPPTHASGRHMRMPLPSFLRRSDTAGDEGAHADGNHADSHDADPSTSGDQTAPASVNVTVLIAMPSPGTVFPSSRRNMQTLKHVASQKLEEVNEHAEEDGRSSLRRTASIKSFRTAASAKSLGETRREAFFQNLTNEQEQPDALPTTDDLDHPRHDFDDEEELPELVFGTASVPIYSRGGAIAALPNAPRQVFPGTSEAFHPLRVELMNLVRSGHEARQLKERNEQAAKQAEKEATVVDDGQTTIDERSTSRAPLTSAGGPAIRSPAMLNTQRLSNSDTIDSEAGAAIGSSTRQEGLGDVVGRMMQPAPAHSDSEHSRNTTATRDPLLGNAAPAYTT